jgi:tyrosyl-tRNA synthetase
MSNNSENQAVVDTLNDAEFDQKVEALMSGIVDFKPGGREALIKVLNKSAEEKKQLRVKFGIDPTSTDLHIGHMVCIQKLKQFQELGHLPILLIGGFTAQVGDPSGRNSARPPLTANEVSENAKTYLDQAAKVLDLSKVEIVNNVDWFNKFDLAEMLRLASKMTINQMLAKDAFGKRLDEGSPLYIHEVFYPLLQGYDSVEIDADIELGGTDQTFNLMVGRDLQKASEKKSQHIMTMPLLVGLDGVKKMSKSSLNYVALTDSPKEMFGKLMSISDEMIYSYYELCCQLPASELAEIKDKLTKPAEFNPRDLKVALAKRIISIYYDETQASEAYEGFVAQFAKKEIPDDIPEFKVSEYQGNICELLNDQKLVPSKKEAKRMIAAGGIKIAGEKVTDIAYEVSSNDQGKVIQVGKRKFLKLV